MPATAVFFILSSAPTDSALIVFYLILSQTLYVVDTLNTTLRIQVGSQKLVMQHKAYTTNKLIQRASQMTKLVLDTNKQAGEVLA